MHTKCLIRKCRDMVYRDGVIWRRLVYSKIEGWSSVEVLSEVEDGRMKRECKICFSFLRSVHDLQFPQMQDNENAVDQLLKEVANLK